MNRFQRVITGILWLGFLVFIVTYVILYEKSPELIPWACVVCFLAIPALLSLILKFFFRKSTNTQRFQWIPTILNILLILLLFLAEASYIKRFSSTEHKRQLEQREIATAVRQWIKENATYPKTYQPVNFDDFYQVVKEKGYPFERTENYNFTPVGKFFRPGKFFDADKIKTFDYAVYIIEHKFTLQGNNGQLYTVTAYFQLTPELEITNVRLASEMNNVHRRAILYQWRVIFGNKNRTLELEKYGHADSTYKYQFFKDNQRTIIISYARGKLNGPYYIMGNKSDTLESGIFRDDALEILTEFYRTGLKREEGYYAGTEKAGIWNYWDEYGNVDSTRDYGNQSGIDSLFK